MNRLIKNVVRLPKKINVSPLRNNVMFFSPQRNAAVDERLASTLRLQISVEEEDNLHSSMKAPPIPLQIPSDGRPRG